MLLVLLDNQMFIILGLLEEVFGKLKMVGNHGKIYQMVILEVQLEQSQLVYLIQI